MTASIRWALHYLDSLINHERQLPAGPLPRDLKLQRMRLLLHTLGEPHATLPVIHVAGTKGKGSTAAMIASVCQHAGLRTGLYISPHLVSPRERIRIDSHLIEKHTFSQLVRELAERFASAGHDGSRAPTYFEFLTVLAFTHFHRSRVDLAVMEVGLGGRYDATRVCHPILSVITPISHDHTKQLGADLLSIAREKAGIFVPGVPAVVGAQRPYVRRILRRHGRDLGIPFIGALRWCTTTALSTTPQGQCFSARTPCRHYPALELPLVGGHQRDNAATVIAAIETLSPVYPVLTPRAVTRGLAHVHWPGRMQYFDVEPPVLVDCAHNGASAQALARHLKKTFPHREVTLVLGVLRDKDLPRIARALLPCIRRLVVTEPRSPRSLPSATLCYKMVNYGAPQPTLLHSSDDALAWARTHTPVSGLVCVTGSVYLAGEALQGLHPQFAALAHEG